MLALSIRQPYAELILRGVKRVEFRSIPTRIIGRKFYIYASTRRPDAMRGNQFDEARRIWSDDLAVPGKTPGTSPPEWMLQLAENLILDRLPRGFLVGSAKIARCTRGSNYWEWELSDVRRLSKPRRPARQPQPVWFRPF
jgi:hypothetical protein